MPDSLTFSGFLPNAEEPSDVPDSSYVLPVASTITLGGVKIDGSTIAISSEVISAIGPVSSVAGQTGAVVLTHADLTDWASALAVVLAAFAPLSSPHLSDLPTAPTAAPGTNNLQLANTAFVTGAVIASTTGVASFNGRTGGISLGLVDVTNALAFTPYNATNPSGFQTAAQVASAVAAEASARSTADALLAPLASPALSGSPTAPTVASTAAAGTSLLATTAFVRNGTTANDNALMGQVGEVNVPTFAGGAVGSGSPGSLGNMTLSAGDWEITGNVSWVASGGAIMNTIIMSVGTTVDTISGASNVLQTTFTANGSAKLWLGPTRLSLNAPTLVYLTQQVNFTGGGIVTSSGGMYARRMR